MTPAVPHEPAAPYVTLLDGHIERVPFARLWALATGGRMAHSFRYLED